MRTVPWSALLLGAAALGLPAPPEAVSVRGLDQAAEGRSGTARVVKADRAEHVRSTSFVQSRATVPSNHVTPGGYSHA